MVHGQTILLLNPGEAEQRVCKNKVTDVMTAMEQREERTLGHCISSQEQTVLVSLH